MTNRSKEATAGIETIQTTVGDLIEAISEIASEFGKTEQEGYELAALTLERILSERCRNESISEWN